MTYDGFVCMDFIAGRRGAGCMQGEGVEYDFILITEKIE
jgi:hypothetical protein